MYEQIKSYINRYSWVWYLLVAGIACLCCWIIYGGSSDNSSTVEHLERAKKQQRESFGINKDVTDSVERVKGLNQQASERITRIEGYQQQASERIDESAKRLDEAKSLLERNEQLFERVEQRHQAQSPNGTATAPPAQHMGAD